MHNGGVGTSSLVHVNGHHDVNPNDAVVQAEETNGHGRTGGYLSMFRTKGGTAISVPGDTAWQGAQGALVQAGKPPPDLTLLCYDSDFYEDVDVKKQLLVHAEMDIPKPKKIVITWDMSWSDVLDGLKHTFGRAVLFGYYTDHLRKDYRLVASENDFDHFCGVAESRNNKTEVLIVNPVVEPSRWIKEVPERRDSDDEEPTGNGNRGAALVMHEGGVMPGGDVGIGMDFDDDFEKEEPPKSLWQRIKDTLNDTPASAEYMLIFGVGGLFISCAVTVYCYWVGINSVAAVTLALPCNLFLISLLVKEVEDGFGPLFKMGVPFLGFWCAMIVIVCQALADNMTIAIALALWLLSCFWYMEIVVRALGWSSWLQGLYNIIEWMKSGCALPGMRKREPVEHITILAAPDKMDKHHRPVYLDTAPEGATWMPPEPGMKVKHISQCLNTLSKVDGVPMGPWERGIIVKKTARQLRKWLTRRGHPPLNELHLKQHSSRGVGEITSIGKDGARIEWEEGGNPGFYRIGQEGVYELVLMEQEDTGPEENLYDDQTMIHGGGDFWSNTKTFLSLFLPQVCRWLWVWLAFLAYFGMLYIFEISLTSYSVSQAVGGTSFSMAGRKYNAEAGSQLFLHIHCMGYTQRAATDPVEEDGRPPVILIGSEGIGIAAAMARLQELIAQDGVCCVYDRVGYGYSTDREVSDILDDRTPARIARELHYAMTEGRDQKQKRPVFRARQIINDKGVEETVEVEVTPPFVLVGHSAGGLYARQFAKDYPQDTAGVVLVDALPAKEEVKSTIQSVLSPAKMTLCLRFLQPLGLVHTFLPTWVGGLFREKTSYSLNGGDGQPYSSYGEMEYFMFSRQWCPVVLAEYNGIYLDGGLEELAAADAAGYDVPAVVWVRENDRLDNSLSITPKYKLESSRREVECEVEVAGESETVCEDDGDKTSWFDVQRELLGLFRNPWRNPFKNATEIMRGDVSGCATLECTELTPQENPKEIADAVLDLWRSIGYTRPKGTNHWLLEIGGSPEAFDEEQFKLQLGDLLSHVNEKEIFLEPPLRASFLDAGDDFGPPLPLSFDPATEFSLANATAGARRRQAQAPSRHRSGDGHGRRAGFFTGLNGTAYLPVKNDGSFTVGIQLSGHKERSTEWAALVLRGLEDTNLDATGKERRAVFLQNWRVLAVYQRICALNERGVEACTHTPVDIFTSLYTEPIYQCPQNTFQATTRCVACSLESTSRTGSSNASSCFSCPPYQHLRCSGDGCVACPVGKISNRGALDISDCTDLGQWSAHIKGPVGLGSTVDAVTAHREGLPVHRAFDVAAFRAAIARVADVPESKIQMDAADLQAVMPFPESRAANLRGQSVFKVRFSFSAEGASESARIFEHLLGSECNVYDPATCRSPMNFTIRDARTDLLSQFEVLSIFTENEQIAVVPDTCPRQWSVASVQRSEAPILTPEYAANYRCPSGFYQRALGCEACPDMSTSNPGSTSVSDCATFPTVTLTIKDPSVSFDSRTRADIFGGALDAQPNGFDLMNYTGLTASAPLYTKARGYALQPAQLNDPRSPDFGFEGVRCLEGSNCFNSSRFRLELAAALGESTTANNIRIVSARNCLGDGLDGAAETFCGPFPGLPMNAASLSCVVSSSGQQFWTLQAPYIGTAIGNSIEEVPFPRAATAADCAEMCAAIQACTAFLYSRSSYKCVLREIPPGSVEAPWEKVCPSTSRACRESTLDDEGLVESGAQMFWRVSEDDPAPAGTCPIVLEAADSCKASDSYFPNRVFDVVTDQLLEDARGGTGLRSPGDLLHVVFRLHAETRTALERSVAVLIDEGDAAGVRGAAPLGAFLARHAVIQAYTSHEKRLRGGRSPEADLWAQGSLACAEEERRGTFECAPSALASSAWCPDPSGATGGAAPTCDGGVEGDVPACERRHEPQDTRKTGPALWTTTCQGNGVPKCASGEPPECLAENALDRRASFWPLGRDGSDYLTVTFSVGENVEFMEVTRIDVLEHYPYDGVPSDVGIQILRAEFSDGSHQDLELVPGEWDSSYTHVLYIKPVITFSVTLRVMQPGADEARQLGIQNVRFIGQPVTEMRRGEMIDLFKRSESGAAYAEGFKCPATTYRVSTERTYPDPFKNLEEDFTFGGMCMPCPYPKVSPEGSTTSANCTCPRCGDGQVHWQAGERCDDGNTVGDDGCSADCSVEPLHLCRGELNAQFVGQPLVSYRAPDDCIRVGSDWIPYGAAQWPARFGAELVYHRDALWLTGGASSGFSALYNDAWFEATNGAACTVREPTDSCASLPSGPATQWGVATPTAASPFAPRAFHASISFDGFLWVIGGGTHACNATLQSSCQLESSLNDVWKSPGVPAQSDTQQAQAEVQWSEVTGAAAWLQRARHGVAAMDGKLWVIGGQSIEKGLGASTSINVLFLNDVWSSADGAAWDVATANAPWSQRAGLSVVVHEDAGRLFVMGGAGLDGFAEVYKNDVWYTTNGIDWSEATAHAEWTGRWLHRSVFYRESIWVVGGQYCGATVGTREARAEEACVRANGKTGTFLRDVYASTDGVEWKDATATANWPSRAGHAAAVYNSPQVQTFWVLGGYSGYEDAKADLWSSYIL